MKTFVENLLQATAIRSMEELAGPALVADAASQSDSSPRPPVLIEEGVMLKTSILAETDPDLAQAGAALERAARAARRLADQTNTPFQVFIDGQIVDLRKLERETASEPRVLLHWPRRIDYSSRKELAVMKRSFTASVWQEGEWYIAQCMQIDIASQGKTEDDAVENLRDALELHFTPPVATVIPHLHSIEIDIKVA